MIDSSLPPPGAALDAGLINESAHSSLPQALYSMRDLPLCEALLGRCGTTCVFTLERSRGHAFGCTQLCSAACPLFAALASTRCPQSTPLAHRSTLPLLAQALLAPGPSRLPASATLKPSERPLRAVETAASYV